MYIFVCLHVFNVYVYVCVYICVCVSIIIYNVYIILYICIYVLFEVFGYICCCFWWCLEISIAAFVYQLVWSVGLVVYYYYVHVYVRVSLCA